MSLQSISLQFAGELKKCIVVFSDEFLLQSFYNCAWLSTFDVSVRNVPPHVLCCLFPRIEAQASSAHQSFIPGLKSGPFSSRLPRTAGVKGAALVQRITYNRLRDRLLFERPLFEKIRYHLL